MRHWPTAPASILLEISQGYRGHRENRELSWNGYVDGKNWGAIPFAVSSLYRGQTERHLPLLPSIGRGLESKDVAELWKNSIADQAMLILRLAQSWWFSLELNRHPISKHAAEQNVDLDPIALAQHYEIPTGYLDLTDDFNVSAFFATCRKTQHGWEPVESDRVGVVYRVLLKEIEHVFRRYIPLGPQTLPRPTEQCAWVVELPICHSFEGWPSVSMLQFHHDRNVGEYFLEMFDGGKKLFPRDPLAEVAKEILACGEIPFDLIEAAIASFLHDPCGIRTEQLPELRTEISKRTALVGNRRLLTDLHISSLQDDVAWCQKMLSDVKVKWQLIRRVPIT